MLPSTCLMQLNEKGCDAMQSFGRASHPFLGVHRFGRHVCYVPFRSAIPDGARGRGNRGSVERASPRGRPDGRIAGQGPGRCSTGRVAIVLGPPG